MSEISLPNGPLVDSNWLAQYLDNPKICVLESKMKPVGAADDWESGFKIKGAVQMDINQDFSILDTDLPHMMPAADYFSKAARKLGVDQDSVIVVYDQVGTYGSPRAWWMFRAMGHKNVFVLNGGLPAWQKAGFPIEKTRWPKVKKGNFEGKLDSTLIYDAQGVLGILGNTAFQIMDARSQGRFDGTAPEPRPGLRGGHIPGSICLPFQEVQNGIFMKTEEELKAIFKEFELGNKSLVMSCGSGVTASIIALAAEIAGFRNAAVYDGSWSEWGKPSDVLPVEAN